MNCTSYFPPFISSQEKANKGTPFPKEILPLRNLYIVFKKKVRNTINLDMSRFFFWSNLKFPQKENEKTAFEELELKWSSIVKLKHNLDPIIVCR